MAAGGYGSFTRKHGLFIDGVLRAKVVLANGTIVTASPKSNPDLFWAIRGGGGGTYGIVTEATVRLYEYPVVTIGALWTRDLADVVTFMDRYVGGAGRRLGVYVAGGRSGTKITGTGTGVIMPGIHFMLHPSRSTRANA
jgi:FAD/FMN-containing dehydrogenase